MKKIINGKMYNTETAKMMGEWWNGFNTRDFRYCTETLYKKKTGEFFLYGDGGAMSSYAERIGNEYSGGTKIIPFTESQAKKWAENKLDADEYEAIFGTVEE